MRRRIKRCTLRAVAVAITAGAAICRWSRSRSRKLKTAGLSFPRTRGLWSCLLLSRTRTIIWLRICRRAPSRYIENDVLQPIKIFKREDVPVSLGLIIDNSGSMRDKRLKVESAALALVKESNPEDEVFIVNFNDEAFLDQDFTNNIKDMQQGLTKIDSRGGTAMRDAIRMSIDHLKEKGKKDKKVLLVVTDGNDNASIISLENLVRAAQQSDVIVYAIGLLTEEERREAKRAKRALNALTEATGGQVYFPKEVSEVDRIAHQVAHDIRNQYTIGYSPLNAALDGSYRKIRVLANGAGKYNVRTRSGYYATRDKGGATD